MNAEFLVISLLFSRVKIKVLKALKTEFLVISLNAFSGENQSTDNPENNEYRGYRNSLNAFSGKNQSTDNPENNKYRGYRNSLNAFSGENQSTGNTENNEYRVHRNSLSVFSGKNQGTENTLHDACTSNNVSSGNFIILHNQSTDITEICCNQITEQTRPKIIADRNGQKSQSDQCANFQKKLSEKRK